MPKVVIGVMGPGSEATALDLQNAYTVGQLIATEGWVLLTGGRNAGVMHAASQGAKQAGGLTIGILPSADRAAMSEAVDIPVLTGMGSARNNINVLSSQVVIACGMGAGTASEIALALKAQKKVILLNKNASSQTFFKGLAPELVSVVEQPVAALEIIKAFLSDEDHVNRALK
ncbi:TIGR00725 family protein [Trichocoleus sp. FACHB-591]|uniref:TIGR00725 family protein n=1 Tax=Trichocoleus sp. FACHB-591 TaxID=2692872 RepID=UPI00168465E9|nr:TIGR00725 family protein [Trichocoleus sp. FACHB-591]MBD2094771.1 TIGR00725 family protein [Trichocoleus sp. FACHB-591]